MKICFIVPGEPVAKARARVFYNKNANRVMAYTPKKTATYEQFIRLVACDHIQLPFLGPLILNIKVYRSIPKSFSRKLNTMAEAGEVRPTTRPDADNYLKSIADGLLDIAYRDDSQIVSVSVHKFYSSQPRTEIEIEEIKQTDEIFLVDTGGKK